MFKKRLKDWIIGLIVGSIATTSLFSFAGGILANIQATQNSVKVLINGKQLTADNYIIDGRTFLQLRDISDNLGMAIGWDGNTGTVTLNSKDYQASIPAKDIQDAIGGSNSNDPQSQFVSYIEDFLFREHYDNTPTQSDDGLWYKLRYVVDKNYSYDVQKTNSIVSPLFAVVNFKVKDTRTFKFKTSQEAMNSKEYLPQPTFTSNDGEIVNPFYIQNYKYHYVYQSGKWIFKYFEYLNPFNNTWDISESESELSCFGSLAKY